MSSAALLNELQLAQDLVTALLEPLDDDSQRLQYHSELSPLGWHLGHCTYTECYWLQEIVLQDNRYTAPVETLYTPARTPKPERGRLLPPLDALLQWVLSMQAMNRDILSTPSPDLLQHPLMQDDYLLHFLIQHYSQHYETMLSALTQRALHEDSGPFRVTTPFTPVQPVTDSISMQPGHYRVGGRAPVACDNELPAQQVMLGPYRIARNPVSNAEYLAFMDDAGYSTQSLWSDAGWQWRTQAMAGSPDHWRQDDAGHWYGSGVRGAYELDGSDVVHGLSHHEASAYASWAGRSPAPRTPVGGSLPPALPRADGTCMGVVSQPVFPLPGLPGISLRWLFHAIIRQQALHSPWRQLSYPPRHQAGQLQEFS